MDNSYYSCNRCTFGTVSSKRYNDHISGHETQVQNGKPFALAMTLYSLNFNYIQTFLRS